MGNSLSNEEQDRETQKGDLTSYLMGSKYSYLRAFALKTYLHLFIIAVIGVTAYSNTFHSPFVFDDIDMIKDNQMIRNLDNFLLVLKGHDFGSTAYQYSTAALLVTSPLRLTITLGELMLRGITL